MKSLYPGRLVMTGCEAALARLPHDYHTKTGTWAPAWLACRVKLSSEKTISALSAFLLRS